MAETLDRYFRATQFFLEAQYKNSLAGFYDAVKDRKQQQQYFQESLAAYEEAVRLNPDDASARYLHANAVYGYRISLGIMQLSQGRSEDAAETFRAAAALKNPFKPDLAYLWLGRALNRMESPARAFEALEEALRRFPGSPDALAERGYARFLLGDFRAAEADFRAALASPVEPEMDDKLRAAWKRLGNLAEKGLLPEAKPRDEEIASLVATVRREMPTSAGRRCPASACSSRTTRTRSAGSSRRTSRRRRTPRLPMPTPGSRWTSWLRSGTSRARSNCSATERWQSASGPPIFSATRASGRSCPRSSRRWPTRTPR